MENLNALFTELDEMIQLHSSNLAEFENSIKIQDRKLKAIERRNKHSLENMTKVIDYCSRMYYI